MIWRLFGQENRALNIITPARRAAAAAAIILVLAVLPSLGLGASADAVLFGSVTDGSGAAVGGARVGLKSADGLFGLAAATDRRGRFEFCGVPPGECTLTVGQDGAMVYERRDIVLEPGATLRVRITVGGGAGSAEFLDLSPATGRTVISRLQMDTLPSANNVWSLIENQDLSATTNRIDVGGVWADMPALWSSRGSSSWTQSSYLLDGLSVSDPYATGTPMLYPDLFSLNCTVHDDGRLPIDQLSPGGAFNLIPKRGTLDWHGAVQASFTPEALTTSSVPARLVRENLTERTRLSSLGDYAGRVSGPLIPGKLLLFASVSRLDVSRRVAQFSGDDKGTVSSGMVNLTYLLPRGSVEFLWTGQIVSHPTYGAGRNVPVSSTLDRRDDFNVAQVVLRTNLSAGHAFELGASFNHGAARSDFLAGAADPHGEEVFTQVPSGAAAEAGSDGRSSINAFARGTILFLPLGGGPQRFEYGASLRYSASSTTEEVLDDLGLRFSGGTPFEIVRYNGPASHRERALDLHVFAQQTITFANLASLEVGLHLVKTKGWVPSGASASAAALASGFPAPAGSGGEINWTNLSPRAAFSLPLSRDRSFVFRVSAARYFFDLPLSYLAYGNPGALGGLAYAWNDLNHDGLFQDGEQGGLVRREGPYFASIDPRIERPRTDEYCVSLSKAFRSGLVLSLAGYYRETSRLVETLNVGVPLDAYDPVTLHDAGDDFVPGNADDLTFTVYNQRPETLGRDFFSLTNAGGRRSIYRGLDLTLVKRFSPRTVLFVALTATEAWGTTSPGNSELENDDGIIGALYDNPNAEIRARGRLRFDRAYTARIGVSLPVPGGFRLSALAKYYDGQPFARKIIVEGFNQGPFYIMAHYRGNARYEFDMTVDVRAEKSFAVGRGLARLFVEGYNIFDQANATEESPWTGPQFVLRYATEVQSPRVFRVGLAFEF